MGIDKNGIGNRGLKEVIRTTHEHELRGGWWKGNKGRKIGKTIIS